ncbi:SDR family oxidoreductase [bacterium]|nr:SDR family oxidoreductase [bacterium]
MSQISHQTKIAIITGASSGIGKSIAHELAQRGYRLLLIGRTESELNKTADECKKLYCIDASIYSIDLSDLNAVYKLVDWLKQFEQDVEILVNNAGFGILLPFSQSAPDEELKMVNVHINSMILLTKLVLQSMINNQNGYILNVSSIYGFGCVPYQSIYGATKAFINSFSFALREELRDSGVSVTTLCPGSTQTNFRRFLSNESGKPKGMKADEVARQACLDLFNHKVVSIPGRINHIFFYMMWFFPATYLARIVRLINNKRGMNK